MAKKKRKKSASANYLGFAVFITILLIIAGGLYIIFRNPETVNKTRTYFSYPTDYEEYVIRYSSEYGIDPRYVFAVIYVESRFNENAESDVGARGLMQVMSDAFDWIKFRLGDERDISFDDMYDPELNIQYGTYMLSYLYDRFGSYELASAAYHQGMNAVQTWIDNGTIDPDSFSVDNTLDDLPSQVTQDYIYSVMKAFEKYKDNYQLEEDISNGKQD